MIIDNALDSSLSPGSPEDERHAGERLAHVHGAGELQAVLLALLLPPGSKRALRAWRTETGGTSAFEALRAHAANLSGAARLPWFERLLARMAAQPLAARLHALLRGLGLGFVAAGGWHLRVSETKA